MKNRDIKFRIWDKAPTKDGFEGIMIDMDYALKSDYLKSALQGKYPIMQFTGRKAKDGKDIYEGDIVKVKGMKRIDEYNTTVIWEKQGFTFKLNKTYLDDDSCFVCVLEVIGNIYENPELI